MKKINMIITNPGYDCSTTMNISWHSSEKDGNYLQYREKNKRKWNNSIPIVNYCDVFNDVYSITTNRIDTRELIKFYHCKVCLKDLKPNTDYCYRINGSNIIYRFKTASSSDFSFVWISDFHSYPPCSHRLKNASDMIEKIIKKHPLADFIFCSGDSIAWGGSYSFWDEFYSIPSIKKYMWANTLGNHDYMSRANEKNTSEYFREVNFFPENGYDGEVGVCYYFKYANALFIVLHNEHMGVYDIINDEVKKAQDWVEKVIENNPSDYIFLCQHYQWINGVNGRDRNFGYNRWKDICDKYNVDLAIAANDHTYLRTYPIYKDEINNHGTVYMQCPSSDGERGQDIQEKLENDNKKIAFRYSSGPKTVAGIYVDVKDNSISIKLYDNKMKIIDSTVIEKKIRQK